MNKNRSKIEVEIDQWISIEGVQSFLYFGDECNPSCESPIVPLETLIRQEIEAYRRGWEKQPDFDPEAEKFVESLEKAAEYARSLLGSK